MFIKTTATNPARLSKLVAVCLMAIPLSGCAELTKRHATQYQTVVTGDRHDTPTAQQKHREALVHLDCPLHACDFAKAERLLNEALVADVTYGPAHNSLGTLYFMQDKFYLAAWEFEYAAKLMPDMAQPYNNLGLVYERVGKYEEAISYYSIAISHSPDDPELIGNLVRARMITGERTSDLKHMVSDLALNHPQANWQRWARDAIELTKFDPNNSGLRDEWRIPDVPPEAMPAPIDEDTALQPILNPPRNQDSPLPPSDFPDELPPP